MFFPVTLVHAGGYSAEIAAISFAGGHLCAAGGRLVWGRLSDKRYRGNRTIPMVYCAVLGAGAAMLLSGIGHIGIWTICLAAAGLGFAAEGWFGLALIAMAESGGEEHAGGALGFGFIWMFAAALAAPVGIGLVEGSAGYGTAWSVTAALGLLPARDAQFLWAFVNLVMVFVSGDGLWRLYGGPTRLR